MYRTVNLHIDLITLISVLIIWIYTEWSAVSTVAFNLTGNPVRSHVRVEITPPFLLFLQIKVPISSFTKTFFMAYVNFIYVHLFL